MVKELSTFVYWLPPSTEQQSSLSYQQQSANFQKLVGEISDSSGRVTLVTYLSYTGNVDALAKLKNIFCVFIQTVNLDKETPNHEAFQEAFKVNSARFHRKVIPIVIGYYENEKSFNDKKSLSKELRPFFCESASIGLSKIQYFSYQHIKGDIGNPRDPKNSLEINKLAGIFNAMHSLPKFTETGLDKRRNRLMKFTCAASSGESIKTLKANSKSSKTATPALTNQITHTPATSTAQTTTTLNSQKKDTETRRVITALSRQKILKGSIAAISLFTLFFFMPITPALLTVATIGAFLGIRHIRQQGVHLQRQN